MRQFKVTDRLTQRSVGLQRYLNEVSSIKMITPDEEAKIAERAAKGDELAIQELVKVNLRFVVSVAKSYSGGKTSTLEDLINEGNLGLLEAAKDFDPSTGFKFISYAVWHVRKNMLKYLTNNGRSIRLPQNQVNFLTKSAEITSNLSHELDRDPTQDEIIDAYIKYVKENRGVDIKKESLVTAMESSQGTVQLDPLDSESSDENFAPISYIKGNDSSTDHDIINQSARKILFKAIDRLKDIDRKIVIMKIGLHGEAPCSYQEIGNAVGKTGESVRLRYRISIKKLGNYLRAAGISMSDIID